MVSAILIIFSYTGLSWAVLIRSTNNAKWAHKLVPLYQVRPTRKDAGDVGQLQRNRYLYIILIFPWLDFQDLHIDTDFSTSLSFKPPMVFNSKP